MRPWLLGIVPLLAMVTVPAAAADIAVRSIGATTPRGGSVAIYYTGTVKPGDAQRLSGAIASAEATRQPILGIFLNSPGGAIREAVTMAHTIRASGHTTVVSSNYECASACVLLMAAGRTRLIYKGAKIGVHSASDRGIETPEAASATLAMAREAAQLGVPDVVIGHMVATRASGIKWLSTDELTAFATPGGYSEAFRLN